MIGFPRNDMSNGSNDMNFLNLEKGDILNLEKNAPTLKNVIVAAGWDLAPRKGKKGEEEDFDLDLSAFLLDSNGKIMQSMVNTKVVYFLAQAQKGIYLEEDNLTGGNEDENGDKEDDERINVSLDDIEPSVQSIVFNVNIYKAMVRKQTFGMVNNSYIRLLDADDNEKELCRYCLKENASSATGVTFAKLVRNRNGMGWSFETIGESRTVADLNQLLRDYIVMGR